MYITKEYLRSHPNEVFVFGDNLLRKGKGGAAVLRDEPNTYGFITKKYPNNDDISFYRPGEYGFVFDNELSKLIELIKANPEKIFLIPRLGGGLANKYKIREKIIEHRIKVLEEFSNVKFV